MDKTMKFLALVVVIAVVCKGDIDIANKLNMYDIMLNDMSRSISIDHNIGRTCRHGGTSSNVITVEETTFSEEDAEKVKDAAIIGVGLGQGSGNIAKLIIDYLREKTILKWFAFAADIKGAPPYGASFHSLKYMKLRHADGFEIFIIKQ